MITIRISREEKPEAVARVRALLDEVVLRDPNWNGAVFEIERDDWTCVDDDSYEGAALLADIQRVLRNESE